MASSLLNKGSKTLFGKDHNFDKIKNYEDFKQSVPIRDYESLKSYVELIKSGKENVLWPGKPVYFAITSGTTSGAKYIPITAVKNIKATVFKAPTLPPILINKNISKAGIPIKKRKNGFICLIQKYMINVYLSNYE